MAETFTCDNCGRELPRDQMKEVFRKEGDKEIREELCAQCRDKKMNESPEVYGVEGQEKRRAAFLADSKDEAEGEEITGKRE